MSKTKKSKPKFPIVIRARVSEEIRAWYIQKAKNRKMKVSEFIRKVPDIIESLEDKLDNQYETISSLKKKIFELEKKITEMEEWACQ